MIQFCKISLDLIIIHPVDITVCLIEQRQDRFAIPQIQPAGSHIGFKCLGIFRHALRQVGAKAAWLKIQEIDPSACIHRLLALESAIEGVKKTGLPDTVKADLKAFYQEHKL